MKPFGTCLSSLRGFALLSVFTLTACGGGGDEKPNTPPTADAGLNQTVDELTLVTLSGSGRDTDGSISSYSWTQTAGTDVTLSNADTAQATFEAPDINPTETLTFSLTVTDNSGAQANDTVDITVVHINQSPTVTANSAQTVDENSTIELTAVASDSDGEISSVSWAQVDGPSVQFSDASSLTTNVILPLVDNAQETVTLAVTVTDNEGATATAETVLTVEQIISNLSATMIAPTNAKIDEPFLVSASGSTSDGVRPLQYSWEVISQPSGSSVTIGAESGRSTTIDVDVEGDYIVRMTISDGTASATVERTVIVDLDGDGILAAEDIDKDGDGIINSEDDFPDDYAKYIDSDGDGITNEVQVDEDGDGTEDVYDDYPFDATQQSISAFVETEYNGNLYPDGDVISSSLPLLITGAVDNGANGVDNDYFLFNGSTAQLISFVLVKDSTVTEFEPVITVIDAGGSRLSSVALDLGKDRFSGVAVRLPSDGQYAVIVGDSNNYSDPSFSYALSVFQDSDFDGLADDKELALGSLVYNPDSDFDGISDFIELALSSDDLSSLSVDFDNDGLPNFWDLDSDGDGVADANEGAIDADIDGLANMFDIDSDGNGTSDGDDLGTDPLVPLDSDNDLLPNFIDIDDDNDAINDSNDPDDEVQASVGDIASNTGALSLDTYSVVDPVSGASLGDIAREGDTLTLEGSNFGASPIVLLVQGDDIENLTPDSATESSATFTLPDGVVGRVSLSIFDGSEKSEALEVSIEDAGSPVITGFITSFGSNSASQGEYITITGENFTQGESVNVSFNGESASGYTTSTSAISVYVPYTASSGEVVVVTDKGTTNGYSLQIKQSRYGQVTLPSGSALSLTDLTVEFTGVSEDSLDASGNFGIDVNANDITSISVFAPEIAGEAPALMLSATVLGTQSSSITVDVTSTAVDLLFSAMGLQNLVSSSDYPTVLDILEGASTDFVVFLDENLSSDPYYLQDYTRSEFVSAYIDAIAVASVAIDDAVTNGLITLANPRLTSKTASSGSTGVLPQEEQEDILVELLKDGDAVNGKIGLENDTGLFTDYQITSSNTGKELRPLANAYFSSKLLGPQQGLIGLYTASTAEEDVKFLPVDILMYTAGMDNMPSWTAFRNSPSFKLVLRTLLSQALVPVVSTAVGLKLKDSVTEKVLKVLFTYGVFDGLEAFWTNPSMNGVASGFGAIFSKIASTDFILNKLIEVTLDGFTAEDVAKMAAKLGLKLTPWGSAATIISTSATAIDLAKMATDMATTDMTIQWKVTFPVTVDSVSPGVIINDNSAKKITLRGTGLNPVVRKSIFGNNVYSPTVTFTDADGKSYTDESPDYETYLIAPGSQVPVSPLYAQLPADFINEAASPIKVYLNHYRIDEDLLDDDLVPFTLDTEAEIEIVNEIQLTAILPSKGAWGDEVTLSGAGFSSIVTDNTVYFTGENVSLIAATITSASESELTVIVPQNAATGNVFVEVQRNGTTEATNMVNFSIDQGTYTFTYGDNGAANDDTFALYIDSVPVSTMPAPARTVYYTAALTDGEHSIELHGITAPDAVGTYYIRFPAGVTILSGDYTSGSDLTAGVVKRWRVLVDSASVNKARDKLATEAFKPAIIWDEPTQ